MEQYKKQTTINLPVKNLIIGIIVVAVILGGLAFLLWPNEAKGATSVIEGNKQIVNISAKGGFTPELTTIKADMPTTLKITTNNTFDCSSTLLIPSLKISKNLPTSGTTEIEIPAQKSGTQIHMTCSMGMYKADLKVS